MSRKKRLLWLDALRGFTAVSMVLYHGMWDAVWLYGVHAPWYRALPGYVWQQSICWTFIFLAGFSWRFDRRPLKRGMLVSGAGLLITALTLFFMPESRIIFGVLTLIGSCILLMIPLDRLLDHSGKRGGEHDGKHDGKHDGLQSADKGPGGRPLYGFLAAVLLFFLTRNVNAGSLGFERLVIAYLPKALYRDLFTTYFGFPYPSFFSTDYFSLIPWFFLFLAGYFAHGIWKTGKSRKESEGAESAQKKNAPEGAFLKENTVSRQPAVLRAFACIGRHAMLVYILHQPLIMLFFLVTGMAG